MDLLRNVLKRGALAAGLIIAALPPAAAENDIELAPGDTLVFSIIGGPESQRNVTVGVGGTIYLPMVGEVSATGLTIKQLRETLVSSLSDRPYRFIYGGEETWRQMQAEEIYLDVAAYRPIYVMGDVRLPSELPFRPGMTVRQALATVGGITLANKKASGEDPINLLAERGVLRGRIDVQREEIKRIEAVLAMAAPTTASDAMPVTSPDVSTSEGFDSDFLSVWSELRKISDQGNRLVLERTQSRLDVLENLLDANEQSVGFEEAEFSRAQQLAERGVVPESAIIDARRGLLDASTRSLETAGEVLRLKLEIARVSEEADADRTRQHLDLLDSLIKANQTLELLYHEFSAIDFRLEMVGADISSSDYEVELMLFRGIGDETEEQLPDSNTVLLPGDVLSVKLNLGSITDIPRRLPEVVQHN